MNKDRKILIRILSITIVIPFLIFISNKITDISKDRNLLSKYHNLSVDKDKLQSEVVSLEQKKNILTNQFDNLQKQMFSEKEILFYEFCDLIINSAIERNIKIENYSTNESSMPQRLNISAIGKIENILDFLQFLNNFEKRIDINQISIIFNSTKNVYSFSMLINYTSLKINKEVTK